MTIRNRVKEYRMVDPSEVAPNPRNWRLHPDRQRTALRRVLEEIGIAGAVLAYYSPRNEGRLTLIDGHERMTVGVPFPALILDVTDSEADALLATYDSIAQLVDADHRQLEQLLADVASLHTPLQAVLDDISAQYGVFPEPLVTIDPSEFLITRPEREQPPAAEGAYQTIQIHFLTAEARDEFAHRIGRSITDRTTYLWYPESPGYRAYTRQRALPVTGDGHDAPQDH